MDQHLGLLTTHLISFFFFFFPTGSFSEASFAYTPAGKQLYSLGFGTLVPAFLLPVSPFVFPSVLSTLRGSFWSQFEVIFVTLLMITVSPERVPLPLQA